VALRPRLWSGLPLSNVFLLYALIERSRQFWDVPNRPNVEYGLTYYLSSFNRRLCDVKRDVKQALNG
jgi:hypothetical protein